eukprot:6292137-Prymnesium_polylepis.1
MEPNGNTPPRQMSTGGRAYHRFSGIKRGIALTRQGKLGCPAKLRPSIVPSTQSGSETRSQMSITERIEVKGVAAARSKKTRRRPNACDAWMCHTLRTDTSTRMRGS